VRKSGFSIVQVLIAAAVLAGLAVAFSKLLTGSMKSQNMVQGMGFITQAQSTISLMSQTPKSCEGAFRLAGNPISYTPPPETAGTPPVAPPYSQSFDTIRVGGQDYLSVNQTLQGGLKVKTLSLNSTGIVKKDFNYNGVLYDQHVVTLKMSFERDRERSTGAPEVSREISLGLVTEKAGARAMVTCTASAPSASTGLASCVTITANTGTSVATAWCPAGYVAVGGGCSHFYPGANSVPQGIGWYCSNTTQHQGGIAYAVCCKP